MYDFVTTRLPLTPEEQEKAMAILELAKKDQLSVAYGKSGFSPSEGLAFQTFKRNFYDGVTRRLGRPSELDGGWNVSEDGEWLVITQIKEI